MNVKLVGQSSGLRKQEPSLHVLLSRLVRDELQVKGEELARVEIGSKLNEGNTSINGAVSSLVMVLILLRRHVLNVLELLDAIFIDDKIQFS